MSSKIKIRLGALAGLALIAGGWWGHRQLHPLLRHVLDHIFFLCTLTVVLSVGLLALMYRRIIGGAPTSRATFSLLVILLTIVSSAMFGWVTQKLGAVTPTGVNSLDYTIALLTQLVNGANWVLTFGTTAIAVTLLANLFPRAHVQQANG
jgi:uncharacterized membrane protein